MKKIFPLLIMLLLSLSGFGTAAIPVEKSNSNISDSHPELEVEVKGGLGINLVIKNIGDADATDVGYFIFIYGGLIEMSPNSDIGHLGTLAPGESVKANFFTFGFGIGIFADIPLVEGFADCAEGSRYDINETAWIIFGFVLIR